MRLGIPAALSVCIAPCSRAPMQAFTPEPTLIKYEKRPEFKGK